MIDFSDFAKVELRIGTIVEASEHPNADRLVVLNVNLGTTERQVVAGIRQHYQPAQLVGKQIVVVTNLQPVELRGVRSEGMLLAAKDEEGNLALLQPDKTIAPGSQAK